MKNKIRYKKTTILTPYILCAYCKKEMIANSYNTLAAYGIQKSPYTDNKGELMACDYTIRFKTRDNPNANNNEDEIKFDEVFCYSKCAWFHIYELKK